MNGKKPGTSDYRDLKQNGKGHPERQKVPEQADRRWWAVTASECASAVRSNVEFLMKNQQVRMRQMVVSARLYGNAAMYGASGAAYARLLQSQAVAKDRVTYNAVQSIIDTLVSRVGETKPRPYYLTSGGNYKQQRKAKKLNQFVEGVFYETKTYDIGIKAFRDAAIWGDGFIHVFARGGKIAHERLLGSELWIDEVEAQYGYPRNAYRVKLIDRDELAGYFPEKRQEIMDAGRSKEAQQSTTNIADMVTVAESWHLGAMDENGDMTGGKHAITLMTGEKMLQEPEEWEHDFFPFARMSWCERPIGYWSQGLCEQLQGEQLELNKELWLVQRSMHLAGTLKVLVQNGSKIVKEAINNEIGSVINYVGQQPTFYCPEPIHAVFFENINRIIERMYRKSGVSELSSSSKKPAGLNSGRAIREFEDVESDRHRSISRGNDQLYLGVAALDIALAKGLKGYKVRVPGKFAFKQLDFMKDVGRIQNDEFVEQCFPVSRLPREPGERLQTVQEYIQAGMVTVRQGRRLLDFPDIDSIESLANAQEDILTKTLDDMVDEGEYRPPEPTDDLQMAKEMVIEYIQRYRALELEPEKLELLRNWNMQVDELMRRAQPPAPMAAPGITPQAAAQPQPTSDLVPNQPGLNAAA